MPRAVLHNPYKIDKPGVAKPEEYAFGPIAPIVNGMPRAVLTTPYKIDKLGAAKPEEYAFGPIAPIVEGKVVLNGPTGGSASSASSTAPAVASTIVPGSGGDDSLSY
eukprot:gene13153-3474_t